MALRARLTPRGRILTLRGEFTRSRVAEALGITYWSARYWTEKLVLEGLLNKRVEVIGQVRRIFYTQIRVRKVLYRTQYSIMFYKKIEPRSKTPDPIAEFRVTGVSDVRGRYKKEDFQQVCIYTGVILAPQTYWIKQDIYVTADEVDEEIDEDELAYSVSVFKLLNYCERYAVFFKSKMYGSRWRQERPNWWEGDRLPAETARDYPYNEGIIKSTEEFKISAGVLKKRFSNVEGRMEDVV